MASDTVKVRIRLPPGTLEATSVIPRTSAISFPVSAMRRARRKMRALTRRKMTSVPYTATGMWLPTRNVCRSTKSLK